MLRALCSRRTFLVLQTWSGLHLSSEAAPCWLKSLAVGMARPLLTEKNPSLVCSASCRSMYTKGGTLKLRRSSLQSFLNLWHIHNICLTTDSFFIYIKKKGITDSLKLRPPHVFLMAKINCWVNPDFCGVLHCGRRSGETGFQHFWPLRLTA